LSRKGFVDHLFTMNAGIAILRLILGELVQDVRVSAAIAGR
jgi:hypothetical protein